MGSHSRENRLLATSRLFFCAGRISVKCDNGDFNETVEKLQNLVQIRRKYQAFYVNTHFNVIVAGDKNLPKSQFLCNIPYFYIVGIDM